MQIISCDVQYSYISTMTQDPCLSSGESMRCKNPNINCDGAALRMCHHPSCTEPNQNELLPLCMTCDELIHRSPECNGHLVLDIPQKAGVQAHMNRNVSTTSLPATSLSDTENYIGGSADELDGLFIKSKQSLNKTTISQHEQKLRRRKALKSRRHNTDVCDSRSHIPQEKDRRMSSADICEGDLDKVLLAGEEEHVLRKRSKSDVAYYVEDKIICQVDDGVQSSITLTDRKTSKAGVQAEYFTVTFIIGGEEETEVVAAAKEIKLRDALFPIVERRGLDINMVDVFVESSKTPLPMTCDICWLGGNTLTLKEKDGEGAHKPNRPSSASKSTSAMKEKEKGKQTGGSARVRRANNISVDEAGPLPPVNSPYGTWTSGDFKKISAKTKINSIWGPLTTTKDRDKQEQLNDLLNKYSDSHIPPLPRLLTLGMTEPDPSLIAMESHWSSIVECASSLSKKEHDQQEAIWELLHTELSYLSSVQVITEVFMCSLVNLQSESILNEVDTEKLFSNISDIQSTNYNFWHTCLEKVLQASRSNRMPLNPSLLKEGFKNFNLSFHPYTKYCLDHRDCLEYMKTLKNENDLFKTYSVWAEAQKQCHRLRLADLLVKPMQRLTKYSLLLQAILRKTDDDRQRMDLLEMIASVDRFVNEVNTSLHLRHEKERLFELIEKIESYDVLEAPSDESIKILSDYNKNFNLSAPMPDCNEVQLRMLIYSSPLKMKDHQTRMDVHCFLFTDMLLVCKSSRRMDKFKVVKAPMRVDRIVMQELRDKGSFLLISMNEYHVPVVALTFHTDPASCICWLNNIQKAKEMYKEARTRQPKFASLSTGIARPAEEIQYTPMMPLSAPPLSQAYHLSRSPSSSSTDDKFIPNIGDGTVRSLSDAKHNEVQSPNENNRTSVGNATLNKDNEVFVSSGESSPFVTRKHLNGNGASPELRGNDMSLNHSLQYNEETNEDNVPSGMAHSMTFPTENGYDSDDLSKVKSNQRRLSRHEKRYITADAIHDLSRLDKDTTIHKRLSWNPDKHGLHQSLRDKTVSCDSLQTHSIYSSSGVSSNASLHQSPEQDFIENMEVLNISADQRSDHASDIDSQTEDDYLQKIKPETKIKSKSMPGSLNLIHVTPVRDGISSVNLPASEQRLKLTPAAYRMHIKKSLILSRTDLESSEV